MVSSIKATVIIPVYNSGKSILSAVNSVLSQTLQNLELIIVDDGSDQITKNILNKIKDNRVKIIRQNNQGVSVARNTGLDNAHGKYVFFLDADDWIEKSLIEKAIGFAEDNSLDFVCTNVIEHNSTRIENIISPLKNIIMDSDAFSQIQDSLYLWSVWAKLFKLEIIKKNKIMFPTGMNLGEDFYFTHMYIMHIHSSGYLYDSCYYIENINENSLSKKYIPNIEDGISKQIKLWKMFEKKYPEFIKEYYREHISFEFYQVTLFLTNMYKVGSDLTFHERIKRTNRFFSEHREWLEINEEDQKPKSLKEKLMYKIIQTNKISVILLFFMTKERLRRLKFKIGNICKDRNLIKQ